MKVYSIAEFRKNAREALDLAESGENIMVTRQKGQFFMLQKVDPAPMMQVSTKTEDPDWGA